MASGEAADDRTTPRPVMLSPMTARIAAELVEAERSKLTDAALPCVRDGFDQAAAELAAARA